MERFSQFRDRGTGTAPFEPIMTPSPLYLLPWRAFLVFTRVITLAPVIAAYVLFFSWLPVPGFLRRLHNLLHMAFLGWVMATLGLWWADLQCDGVPRGRLSEQPPSRVPQPGSVIAANFTSPVEALWLSSVFNPVFTISYPGSRKVRRVSLLGAILQALSRSQFSPAPVRGLTTLRALLAAHPDRVIVVFPECGTTNGKGILPFSPSLLAVPADTKIFPISFRYTSPDITTPVPGAWAAFAWKLTSQWAHTIRVRIAVAVYNTSQAQVNGSSGRERDVPEDQLDEESDVEPLEQLVLDRVAEALARLGRSSRVGLTLRDKEAFVRAWENGKR